MMPKSEIEKKIRESNIWIAVLLFLSAINIGCAVLNVSASKPLWLILFNTAAAVFAAYAASRWITLKQNWRRIQRDVEFFEKLNAN